MTAVFYSYTFIFIYSGPSGQLPESFRITSGTRAFELPADGSADGPADGGDFHCWRGCLQNCWRRWLIEVPTSLNLIPGPPRQESISFIKKSNKEMVCFWGDSQNHKFGPGEGPWQVDPNQSADIYFFEKSDDCFPSGQLPETFREPSGTHVKQQLPCTLPVRLPEPFRELPELQQNQKGQVSLPVSFRFPSGFLPEASGTRLNWKCSICVNVFLFCWHG